MGKQNKKLLIAQVAALGYEFVMKHIGKSWKSHEFHPIACHFPAVTCSVQATFRTALEPSGHGMIANGLFHRSLMKPMFWEQSCRLVTGPRIWDHCREAGKTIALLFWQQSLGESTDIILSPAPIHKHHGGMIQDCYSKPEGLYAMLCRRIGRPFNLMHYWGPMASARSSQWIVDATSMILSDPAPDICFTYIPVLDYDLQRYGPDHHRSVRALNACLSQLDQLTEAATRNGYDILLYGDYAIGPVRGGALFPNRVLRNAGFLTIREIRGMHYVDFYRSRAFAVVDHEIAHVYIGNPDDIHTIRQTLEAVSGIGKILDRSEQAAVGIDHPNSGELVLEAGEGYWLAYPWWDNPKNAPDYASHIDIHNKPGYDPCELFFGWPPISVSQKTSRIKGSHGAMFANRLPCYWSTFIDKKPDTLRQLSHVVQKWMEESQS